MSRLSVSAELENSLIFTQATPRFPFGKKHTRAEGTAGRACFLDMWALGVWKCARFICAKFAQNARFAYKDSLEGIGDTGMGRPA
jgi:hypothetical protein